MKSKITIIKLRLWWPLLLALVAGIIFASGAAAQSEDTPTLTVLVAALNVRSGPDVSYPAFDTLTQGTTRGIIGYNAETGWWQVVSRFGSPGWVSGNAAYVSVNEAAIRRFVGPQAQGVTPVTKAVTAGILVFQTASGGPIYAINQDGTNLRYLTTGMDPVLSPDEQWVAFSRWDTSQDGALGSLWVINVDGSGERLIHKNVHNPRAPSWSPDGTQIAISMQHGGRVLPERVCDASSVPRGAYDISLGHNDEGDRKFCYTLPPDPHWGLRLIDVATGNFKDLPGDTYSLSPTVDPNNSQHLVYDGDRGLVNLDLAANKTWALTDDLNDHSPVFSPDGSKIAVSFYQSDHWEVHVMNADGSGRIRLTQTSYVTLVQQELSGEMPHSYNNAAPTWSPDGSQIAFLTDRTDQWEIWVMNADGSNQRPMFPPDALAGIPLHYNGTDDQMLSWR